MVDGSPIVVPRRARFALTPIQKRRLANFRGNGRAFWSLIVFCVLFAISLVAELVANDKPLLISHNGALMTPFASFYPETAFGGDFETEADYTDPVVQCLIASGGLEACLDDPESTVEGLAERQGWILWPLIPWSYDTINYDAPTHPAPPSSVNWLGTDTGGRDVAAIVVYGVRLSVTFGLFVTLVAAVVGVAAGAVQGYFGGWTDLVFQRVVEIWTSMPFLLVLMIMSSLFPPSFWMLAGLVAFFTWTAFVGVVRAEFLRARNFEYVMAARALGVSDWTIMFRHVLPNAMVATLTIAPFVLTGAISTLAVLDYLGFGLAGSHPSLGDIGLQGRQNLQAPWLGLTAFFTLAIMLSLLVFIFEGVRDAFDPRKVFVDQGASSASEVEAPDAAVAPAVERKPAPASEGARHG